MTDGILQPSHHQRIRAAESRIEFALAGIMTFLIAGTFLYVHSVFAPLVPTANLRLWTGFFSFVIVLLIVVPLVVWIRRPSDLEIATTWSPVGKVVTALFDLAVASSVWLLFPFASEQLQLLMVVFFCATISAQVISTAESIDNITFGVVVIFGSAAWFFLQSHSTYAISVAVFLMAYGGLMIGVALVLKYAVRSAIESKLRAEDASKNLAQALNEAQKARDDRTAFLAAASHDLRQPIQAAMLFFQQLLISPHKDTRSRAQDGVRAAFLEANALLDRMLEHLRLESGTMPMSVRAVDLAPLIATLAQEHDLIVKEAGMNLRAYGGRHWVNADPHLITRILRNLIHNACTHSRGQRLRIFTRQMGDCVRLYIVDDGLGIGEAHESCFEPFVQGKIALSNAQGMGLGLAVSRDMAQLMGGRLDLDGRWRAGAAFFLELPTANRPQAIGVAPPMSKAGRKGLYGLKIIVIDNDTGARTALSELLSLLASDVRAVSSLAELSALRFEAPDLIVSDWHLGDGIHGDAAITLARGRWPEIAAIVVTGDGASQTLRAMSALNVPVLWKPIDIDALGVMAERVTAGDLVKGGLQREAAFV